MLEEQQQHGLPYQPYNGPARRGYRPQPPRDAPPEKDTVSDIQDQISRFAECEELSKHAFNYYISVSQLERKPLKVSSPKLKLRFKSTTS